MRKIVQQLMRFCKTNFKTQMFIFEVLRHLIISDKLKTKKKSRDELLHALSVSLIRTNKSSSFYMFTTDRQIGERLECVCAP